MVRTDFIGRGVPWVLLLLRLSRLDHDAQISAGGTGSAPSWRSGRRLLIRVARSPRPHRVALVALNRSFYALLARRGPAEATTGVFLHALHHLASLAAVPVGVLLHLLDRPRRRR